MEAADCAGVFTFDVLKSDEKNKEAQQYEFIKVIIGETTKRQMDAGYEEDSNQENPIQVQLKIVEDEKTLETKKCILDTITTVRGTNLSGGFAQSVAMARIFLRKRSRVIILDESMSAMDPIKKSQVIFPNLLKFARKHCMTLILISHDMTALDHVDHVILLEKGIVVCQGEVDAIRSNEKLQEMLGASKGETGSAEPLNSPTRQRKKK